MTRAQQKLVELDRRKEEYRAWLEELTRVAHEVAQEIGIEGYFQDPSDGTVFKIVIPTGKWIPFELISYLRTKRDGEEKGTLSIKEARENGFNI